MNIRKNLRLASLGKFLSIPALAAAFFLMQPMTAGAMTIRFGPPAPPPPQGLPPAPLFFHGPGPGPAPAPGLHGGPGPHGGPHHP